MSSYPILRCWTLRNQFHPIPGITRLSSILFWSHPVPGIPPNSVRFRSELIPGIPFQNRLLIQGLKLWPHPEHEGEVKKEFWELGLTGIGRDGELIPGILGVGGNWVRNFLKLQEAHSRNFPNWMELIRYVCTSPKVT
jgi:hypothetical protein